MTPKLEKIWIGMRSMDEEFELRLDWSNDRHHAILIANPQGPDQIAEALKSMAMLVFNDPHLRAKAGRKE